MAKKQIFKTDGSEDFDAESKQLDEAAAPGLIDDDGKDKPVDAAPEGDAPKVTDEKAEGTDIAPPVEAAPVEGDDKEAEAPESKPADAPAASSTESAAPAPSEPDEFGDLHEDVSELGEALGSEAMDELKKAGNALTPAVSKLHGIEAKLEKLSDEAKARFTFAKQQVINAMGALERIFKRGK